MLNRKYQICLDTTQIIEETPTKLQKLAMGVILANDFFCLEMLYWQTSAKDMMQSINLLAN